MFKEGENKYIAQCLEEIKQELRQYNLSVKANAVAKLNYLQMLGYDISWAGFNVIEVCGAGVEVKSDIENIAGDVQHQVYREKDWLSCCKSELPSRYRGLDVGH